MKDNRRDFLKKSASLAATLSVGGIGAATAAGHTGRPVNNHHPT